MDDVPQFEVDFSAKKTEAGWLATQDRFWLAFTPKLFEWLGWVAVMAALQFVNAKQRNGWLDFLVVMCDVALFWYFMAFFCRFKFVGIPWLRREWALRLASITLSVGLALAAIQLARLAARALAYAQP